MALHGQARPVRRRAEGQRDLVGEGRARPGRILRVGRAPATSFSERFHVEHRVRWGLPENTSPDSPPAGAELPAADGTA